MILSGPELDDSHIYSADTLHSLPMLTSIQDDDFNLKKRIMTMEKSVQALEYDFRLIIENFENVLNLLEKLQLPNIKNNNHELLKVPYPLDIADDNMGLADINRIDNANDDLQAVATFPSNDKMDSDKTRKFNIADSDDITNDSFGGVNCIRATRVLMEKMKKIIKSPY